HARAVVRRDVLAVRVLDVDGDRRGLRRSRHDARRARAAGELERRTDRYGLRHGDPPEDAVVLHPLRALDDGPDVEVVDAGRLRRADAELEPCDLIRSDVIRGLDRDAVVARPAGVGRAELAVTAEDARLVLAGDRIPRAEVRDLAKHALHPAERAGVVHRYDRGHGVAGTERHVAGLSVPRGVEARDAGRDARGRRDARSDARLADRSLRRRGLVRLRDRTEGSGDEKKAGAQGRRGHRSHRGSSLALGWAVHQPQRACQSDLPLAVMAGAAHAHGPDEEHESRYREGDAAAWDRPLRDTELYDPARRDVYNFIDETKVRHLRPLLPPR